jgi:Cation transporter/ATPase, N-terminus
MDDNTNSNELKEKEPNISTGEVNVSPTTESFGNTRRLSEAGPRIIFAPDPRAPRRRQQTEDVPMLPLSRTFSRQKSFSSYSVKIDEEHERVRRVASRKTIEPHTRLPVGTFSPWLHANRLAYRTLSIGVTDTVTHRVEPPTTHVKDIADLDWHKIPIEEALRRQQSSQTQGLNNNQAQSRLQQNGKNVLSPPPTHRVRKMYLSLVSC